MRPYLVALVVASAVVAGCGEVGPEAARERGGGPGADIGNRPAAVKMHAGSDPYWQTPDLIPVEGTTLVPARDAQRVSQ